MKNRSIAVVLALVMMLSVVMGSVSAQEAPELKYIFLFIGDGMSYPQFQTAAYYLGQLEQPTWDKTKAQEAILGGGNSLSFMQFPVAGSAITFDSTSFAPDSASTATSIATGYKTYSGIINVDETKTVAYTTIAEMLKEQKGFQIGIVSSVNMNHATPAAFYAHQPSRNNYYEIGEEMIASGFEYFAGGGLKSLTGKDKDKTSLYDIAKEAGYTVAMTNAEAEAINAETEKAIVVGEVLADSDALSYDQDRAEGEWSLADYTRKGIEVINNETGFFMMVEGGKIDWACHANDAGSTIADTIALDEAVKVAEEFAAEHPEETLILVTADHETGGLTIGWAGTEYATYLANLQYQTISQSKFDADFVAGYVENQTSFEDAMADVTAHFGLVLPQDAANAKTPTLVLNDYDVARLREAYEITLSGGARKNAAEYLAYGGYEPFTITVNHILNNKSGINFASYSHTGLPVAVFAQGNGQDLFKGYYDNTEIFDKMVELTGVTLVEPKPIN